jgi:hypothetical protein
LDDRQAEPDNRHLIVNMPSGADEARTTAGAITSDDSKATKKIRAPAR